MIKRVLLATVFVLVTASAEAQVGIPPIGYSGGTSSGGGGGSGTVTTTGSPASGNLSKFSGATSVTNTDLSGDVTTSGSSVTTVNSFGGGTVFGDAAPENLEGPVIDDGSGNLTVQDSTDAQKGIVQVDGTSIVAVDGVISAAAGSGNVVISPTTGNVIDHCVSVRSTTTGIKDSGAPCALSTTTHQVTGSVAITAAQFNNQDPWQIKATATITLPQSNGTPSLNNGLVLLQNTGTYVPTFAINAGDCIKVSGDAACGTTGASYVGTANYSYIISSDGAGTIFIEPIAPSGASTSLTVGTTPIASGTTLRVLYDLAGVLGEMTTSGSGTQLALTTSPTFVTPVLGTVAAGSILTNATGLPVSTGISGFGTGIATALGVNVGSSGAPVVNGGALGTPLSGVGTNLTGTASGLTAGNVTTNANLTGVITSVGNATSIASQTGTGTKFVVDTSPILVTPVLGVATATSVNKVAITAPATSSTITVADGKTLTASNSITLAGTDSTTMTFPTTSATVARTDAANTFTGVQTFSTPIASSSVAAMTATVGGGVPTPPNNTTTFLRGDGTFAAPAGGSGGGMFNYSDNGVTLTAGTYYVPIGGGGIPQGTEANVSVKSPSATTVSNLQVSLSADPGSGQTLAVTLRKGGSDQSVTCTITGSGGGTATTCQDLTHSFNVAQDDVIDWKIVTTGTYVATPTVTITAANGTSGVGVTTLTAGTNVTLSSGSTCTSSCTINSKSIDRTAISGRWYWARRFTAASGTTIGANTVRWMPFTTNQTLTIDQIGFRVTTGVSSSTCDVFVFTNNTSGLPGTLVGYAASISTGTSNANANSAFTDVSDVTFTAGNTYWLGIGCSTTGVIMTSSATSNSANGYIAGATSLSNLGSGTNLVMVSYSTTYTYGNVPGTDPTITEGVAAAQAEPFFHVE